ncbi:unnamed protein product, partial [Staurois parvus]
GYSSHRIPQGKSGRRKKTQKRYPYPRGALFGGLIQSKGGPGALNIPERRLTHHYLVSAVNVGFALVDGEGIKGTEESNEITI